MTWWEAALLARAGKWVQRTGWSDPTGRVKFSAGVGTVPAVLLYASSTRAEAVATGSQFGAVEFAANDWVEISDGGTTGGGNTGEGTTDGGGSSITLEDLSGAIEYPAAGVYPIILSSAYQATLSRITAKLTGGSATLAAKIESRTIGTLAVSTTENSIDLAETLDAGQTLSFQLSAISSAAMLAFTVTFRR